MSTKLKTMENENINTGNIGNGLSSMVNELKVEDKRNVIISKILFGVMGLLVILMAYPIFTNPGEAAISSIFFTGGMIFGAIYYLNAKNKFSKVDYSLPTLTMLKQAVKRHNFMQKRFLNIIGMIACFEIGFVAKKPEMIGAADGSFPWIGFLMFQGLILAATAIGFAVEYAVWYGKQKPVRDKSLELIKDIEE